MRRIGYPRQLVAGSDQLTDLDIHQLQNAVHTGPDPEPVNLFLAQCQQSLHLLDACLLGHRLRFHGRVAGVLARPF